MGLNKFSKGGTILVDAARALIFVAEQDYWIVISRSVLKSQNLVNVSSVHAHPSKVAKSGVPR